MESREQAPDRPASAFRDPTLFLLGGLCLVFLGAVWVALEPALARLHGVWMAPVVLLLALRLLSVRAALRQQVDQLAFERESQQAHAQARAELLARLAHEIRGPTHSILALAESFERNDDELDRTDCQTKRSRIGALRSSATLLSALVGNTLDLARAELAHLELHPTTTHLPSLVEECVAAIRARAHLRGLKLTSSLDPRAPTWIRIDSPRFRQILLNLLENALKYTQEGSVELRARLEESGTTLLWEIEDTGIGISERDQRQLFVPFGRAETTVAQAISGSGLGLSICRLLVSLMDGEIGCRSQRGVGSTFWVRLPVHRTTGPVSVDSNRSLTVAVVDDDPVHRLILRQWLAGIASEISSWASLAEIRDGACALETIDVLLLDLRTPGTDGLGLVERWKCRGDTKSWPTVIAMTAELTKDLEQDCESAGITTILHKPFDQDNLLLAIEGALRAKFDSTSKGPRSAALDALMRLAERGRPQPLEEALESFRSIAGKAKELLALPNPTFAETAESAHCLSAAPGSSDS